MSFYTNALQSPADLAGWIPEGPAAISQGPSGVVLASSATNPDQDSAHWTLWCPVPFADRVRISWDFRPIEDPGLAMVFFSAQGHSGELFGPGQLPRDGRYPQYHSGDINALHLSYFRRRWPQERAFRTCNLRRSSGFHLVAQGADPLPPAVDADGFYRLVIDKDGPDVRFSINGLPLFTWHDDGTPGGAPLTGGHFGFRQMAPLVAEYRNLSVCTLNPPT
ncbi:hypothetical protein ABIB35_003514 [Arthrobacter sp. UYP6]|uniref:DUF1961 family protein n=1 Tax=Arthrobacter sp. UYP6 TaxID=1756378 RepID=UPI003390A0DF